MSVLDIPTPRVFLPLLEPARYKGVWGGRGSGKSNIFAEMIVERFIEDPTTRVVCIREVQKSLKESAKRLIEDKIQTLGQGHLLEVQEAQIKTRQGGLIVFNGMQDHTAESIKSLEGFDLAFVEEAQALSRRSLRLLRPTLRKEGSELWFAWNPRKPTDPIDEFLRGEILPDGAIVIKANWSDNPFFPEELRKEMELDRVRYPDTFENIWNGEYESITEALIFNGKVEESAFETPEFARFFFGADFGFANDPNVLIRCFIQDECLFIDHEAYGYRVELDEMPAFYDSVPESRKWPIKGDAARPETISYLARQGFRIEAAEKWPGSVEDGIVHLRGFRKIVIHPRCPHTAKDFRMYSYKVDPKTEDVLPILVDKFDHAPDAVRYSLDGYIMRRGVDAMWAKLAS